jgi:hypothetical protein
VKLSAGFTAFCWLKFNTILTIRSEAQVFSMLPANYCLLSLSLFLLYSELWLNGASHPTSIVQEKTMSCDAASEI